MPTEAIENALPGQGPFVTKRRAPFKFPCERCLHYGFTRTYASTQCYFREIMATVIIWIIVPILLAIVGANGAAKGFAGAWTAVFLFWLMI